MGHAEEWRKLVKGPKPLSKEIWDFAQEARAYESKLNLAREKITQLYQSEKDPQKSERIGRLDETMRRTLEELAGLQQALGPFA